MDITIKTIFFYISILTFKTSWNHMVFCSLKMFSLQLFMIDNGTNDWQIATCTWRRLLLIILELLVCAVCPLPFVSYQVAMTVTHAYGDHTTHKSIELDVILSIPMFLRFYWIGR